jgi:hypothetical protein
VGTLPIPVPSGALRNHALPSAESVVEGVHRLLGSRGDWR